MIHDQYEIDDEYKNHDLTHLGTNYMRHIIVKAKSLFLKNGYYLQESRSHQN